MTFNSQLLNKSIKLLSGGETVKVRRKGDPTNVKGRLKPNFVDAFDIIANVQPVSGRELLNVEEGDRDRQRLDFYTRTKLIRDDELERDDEIFDVELVESWGPYFMARAVLKDA